MTNINAPQIPIRLNRSVKLRQQNGKHTDKALFVPQKAEHSHFVSGQNKAAEVILDKQLQAWYRAKDVTLEKLNRFQNIAYEEFLRIEEEKRVLIKYSDMLSVQEKNTKTVVSESEEAGKDTDELSTKTIDGIARTNSTLGAVRQGTPALPPVTEETSNTHCYENKTKPEYGPRHSQTWAVGNSERSEQSTCAPCNSSGDAIVLQVDGILLSTDAKPICGKRPKTHIGFFPEMLTPRSREQTDIRLSSSQSDMARRCSRKNEKSTPGASVETSKLPGSGLVADRRIRNTTAMGDNILTKRSSTGKQGQRPDSKFTNYRRDRNGIITASDIPYKRRHFPGLRQKDTSLNDRLLLEEQNHQLEQEQKFKSLQESITKLEEWSPLELLRSLRPQEEPEAKAPKRTTGLVGSLDSLSRAFRSIKEEDLLKGMDPDSPEALKLCKYIRKTVHKNSIV